MKSKKNAIEDDATPTALRNCVKEWEDWKRDQNRRFHAKREEIAQRYGIMVKLLRANRRFSQKQLAQMIGSSTSVIGKIEAGLIIPSEEINAKMIDFFRKTPEFRFGRENLGAP